MRKAVLGGMLVARTEESESEMAIIDLDGPEPTAPARYAPLPCELYQAWRAAQDDAEDAFRAWCASPSWGRAEAYAVYRAAVDREDTATEHWLAV